MKKSVDFVWLEGELEAAVARKLLPELSLDISNAAFGVAKGNSRFWQEISRRNASAKAGLTVVALGDLEQEPCAGQLIARHLPRGCDNKFVLRLAVRMLESWLLADSEKMAAFLHIPLSKLPIDPDNLKHPKHELVRLAQQHGTKAIRQDLVPEQGHSGIVGKGYRPRIEEFIQSHWRPRVAAKRSPSLRRAILALEALSKR
ncbi:MAG: hypothetical protein IPK22_09775 [Verrucomicrobiaceae bacterium]|nr:hypothetical protein [Verrucomicrobiaceae bacterium]